MVTIYINVKVSVELYSVVYFFYKTYRVPGTGCLADGKVSATPAQVLFLYPVIFIHLLQLDKIIYRRRNHA